jgi:hypothetical protein
MSDREFENNPEPVPPASQLAVLPFLAAVDGFLRASGNVSGLRITMHRALTRQGSGFLQQVCGYISSEGLEWRGKVGRIFPVNTGIMGAAYETQRVWRTKAFTTPEEVRSAVHDDIRVTKDYRDPTSVEISFLAVPFLAPQREPVLILYAECKEFNFFADDRRVRDVVAMCSGFCRLADTLEVEDPFLNLRNFPLQKGAPVVASSRGVYPTLQESLDIEPPRFGTVHSFNYEAAVA